MLTAASFACWGKQNNAGSDPLSRGFSQFVTSVDAPVLPAGAVAEWDFHPLESAAFPRRTLISDNALRRVLASLGTLSLFMKHKKEREPQEFFPSCSAVGAAVDAAETPAPTAPERLYRRIAELKLLIMCVQASANRTVLILAGYISGGGYPDSRRLIVT
jgi:hypothetical protein